MITQVSLTEFRNNATSIINRVERAAEPVMLTRRGKVVACIVPPTQAVALESELASDELTSLRAGVALSQAEIRAGLGIPLEEAKLRLRAKWAKKNGKTGRK